MFIGAVYQASTGRYLILEQRIPEKWLADRPSALYRRWTSRTDLLTDG